MAKQTQTQSFAEFRDCLVEVRSYLRDGTFDEAPGEEAAGRRADALIARYGSRTSDEQETLDRYMAASG